MSDTTGMAWTLNELRARRADILALAQQYGVTDIRVFGSIARGEASPGSDIDLIVSAAPGTSMFDLVGLWQDLQELLQSNVSLVTDGIEDKRFLKRIAAEWIAL